MKYLERYGEYMTSNNAPAPYEATSSSNTWGAYRAFSMSLDDDISFTGLTATSPQWVQIKLDQPICIWGLKLYVRTTVSAKDAGQVPRDFTIMGSTDGVTFNTVKIFKESASANFAQWDASIQKYVWDAPVLLEVENNTTPYQYWRLIFYNATQISAQKTPISETIADSLKITLVDFFRIDHTSEEIPVSSITLTDTVLSLLKGTTYALQPQVVPENATDKSLSYQSTNTQVITVTENGIIEAKGAGRANVIITSVSTPAVSVVVQCTVTEPSVDIPVTAIAVTNKPTKMTAGEVFRLAVNILPENATDKTLVYRSSDASIVTISSLGVVTALSQGSATITVSAYSDPTIYDELQLEILSAVSSTEITAIAWTQKNITTFLHSMHLVPLNVTPADYALADLVIATSDANVATYDGFYLQTLNQGSATITVSSALDPTIYDELHVVVSTNPPVINEDFDTLNRQVVMKVQIYFNGEGQTPLEVTKENYLMSLDLLEDSGASSKNPLGSVSANELSFTLYNGDDLFSPTNDKSPYYNKIKTGIIVKPYVTVVDPSGRQKNWLSLGKYEVTEWDTKIESLYVSVTASDVLQNVLDATVPDMPVYLDIAWSAFLNNFLTAAGFSVIVDSSLSHILLYGYLKDTDMGDLLDDMLSSTTADFVTRHDEKLHIDKIKVTEPKATWYDTNQIKAISLEQSITKTYGGVKLTYSLPQLSDDQAVLTVNNLNVLEGVQRHNLISYGDPIFHISAVSLESSRQAHIKTYKSTNFGVLLTTETTEAEKVKLIVTGKNIEIVQQVLTDNQTNELKVTTEYIQDAVYAEEYKEKLTRFVNLRIPELKLTIRGNPLVEIGDTVLVVSQKYSISFKGIVRRLDYSFTGALECDVTLLNAEVIV